MIVLQEAKDDLKVSERLASIVNAMADRQFRVLIIEPTGRCNLKCSFCQMHNGSLDTESQKIDMSDEIFDMIIEALVRLNYKFKSIQLHGYGEPLLNKKIHVMAARLRPYCDSLRLITNGTALTAKMHEKLIAAGIDEIHVSLDVADRHGYKRIKEKDLYEKVIRNIDSIIPWYKTGKGQLFIKIALPEKEYEEFWGDRSVSMANFENSIDSLRGYAECSKNINLKVMPLFSTYEKKTNAIDDSPCEMPFYMLKIKASGGIDCCCAAIFDELKVGHIREGLDLHDKLTDIRRAHLSGRVSSLIPMCGSCKAKTIVNVDSIKEIIDPLI